MKKSSSFKVFIHLLALLISANKAYAAADIEFYSQAADEFKVEFEAVYKSDYKTLDQVQKLNGYQRRDLEDFKIKATTQFIFGPLTHRSLGAEQKGQKIEMRLDQAYLKDNAVFIPYKYAGVWMVSHDVKLKEFAIPLPFSSQQLRTPNWKNCTDSGSDHNDYSFLWYFWDPERYGCDHKLDVDYQMVFPKVYTQTQQTVQTYPEYNNMIRQGKVAMTFGFGYVEDRNNPNPYSDQDYGMTEFRKFLNLLKNDISLYKPTESSILEKKYLNSISANKKIGSQFNFIKDGVEYEIKVVAAADIDQMELFAQSFASEHDAFFGWFGHSRVGSGFDAFQFSQLVNQHPQKYTVTADYQLVYWAGCNSYSYYTKPFFDFKSNLLAHDNSGTKSLDIISNGLPSYFSLNALNAEVLLKALVNPEKKNSYQDIINGIEKKANQFGISVLVNVLGDEDNSEPN